MTPGDRDRSPQLVGGIPNEISLTLEQTMVGFGEPLRLIDRDLSSVSVPHHRYEHRRHQRDLRQLVGSLVAACDGPCERGAGDGDHHEEKDHRGSKPPYPEPVDEREADPDEVEW